jgi:hypothetical protein
MFVYKVQAAWGGGGGGQGLQTEQKKKKKIIEGGKRMHRVEVRCVVEFNLHQYSNTQKDPQKERVSEVDAKPTRKAN